MKLTREQTIKALECCVTANSCDKCPMKSFIEVDECCYNFVEKCAINYLKESNPTPEFDWNGFTKGEFVVNVNTQEEYDTFMKMCEDKGLKWISGKLPTDNNIFSAYNSNTCINVNHENKLMYCDRSYFSKDKGMAVIDFNMIKNEPAPAEAETSSEVSSNDTSNLTHLDDNTYRRICQAVKLVERAGRAILEMYEDMSESERNAFNLGVIRRDVLSSICELEDIKSGDGE